MEKLKSRSSAVCWGIFLVCAAARIAEYFFIRTDETVLSENFIHKLFGIIFLFILLRCTKNKWCDIGFVRKAFFSNLMKGLLLGALCFITAYAVECMVLYRINGNVSLRFFASGFSLSGETAEQTGIQYVLLCIVFNIINVWMEEGVFRGLLSKVTEEKSFLKGTVFIAFLFGIWHLVMPFRDFLEGNSSFGNLLIMGIGYIILAGIMSVKWSLLYRRTGSLWMGLGDHLFNNVIVTNLVHVISDNKADSMQIVRILIGQVLSFLIVLAVYSKKAEEGRR